MNAFDRCAAAFSLVVLSPVLALAGLLIRATSRGPVFYRAQRAGIAGEPFVMFKFRTMRVGSAAAGAITAARDPRVFTVGSVLRKSKLDELPQLFNVLRGEMALVGPRPEDIDIVRDQYDDFMHESLLVRPGVTGPGSLHYFAEEGNLPSDPAAAQRVYLETLLAPKVALDLVFVRHRTFGYAVLLLLRTALGIVGGDRLFAKQAAWELEQAAAILEERKAA